ncbi:MAG: hypothetical protein JRC88_04945 [Deltaproteobacteria bacterium]|nr:hypothetical protein [Deltaproteobacteria bacterium]
MNKKQVEERMAEFAGICQNAENDEKALLEVALFVEDVFGIVLSDIEICEENLGTLYATEKFILKKLQLEKTCVESAE